MAEYDGTGQLLTHFNCGLGPVSQTTAAGANYFYDTDQLGSIVGLSNSSGAYADQYSYLPFGQSLSSSGAVANPFQYLGAFGVQADAPDLLGTAAREYAPSTGAFASSDPLQITAGNPNFYSYAFNQPVQLADPSGLNATSGGESWGRQRAFPFPHQRVAWEILPAPEAVCSAPSGPPTTMPRQLLGGPLYDTAKDIVKDIVKNHELPSLDQVGNTFADKTFDKLNVGPFLIGTIEKTLLQPDFAINIVDGINAVRRSNLCGTINAGEAKQLIEIGMAPPGCADAPGLVAPRVPANAGRHGQLRPRQFWRSQRQGRSRRLRPSATSSPTTALLPYRIDFENASTATAPAQEVVITDQLSPECRLEQLPDHRGRLGGQRHRCPARLAALPDDRADDLQRRDV